MLTLAGTDAKGARQYLCRCDCGTEKVIVGYALKRGDVRSCGCWRRERIARESTTHGHAARGQHSATHRSWASMMTRCRNPQSADWPGYGGRGITVCERWLVFENFLADMGERPPRRTLDRIDVEGNYEPTNCRWATASQQQLNKRARAA